MNSSHLNWLISCPCNDGNFKNHLQQASIETLRYVLNILPDKGNKSKKAVLMMEIKKREKEVTK